MTISKNKGIFSSPVLDGKEDSPSPFWCSKKPFARLVFLCYFEGTVPSGVQTPAPLKRQIISKWGIMSGSIRSANSGSIEAGRLATRSRGARRSIRSANSGSIEAPLELSCLLWRQGSIRSANSGSTEAVYVACPTDCVSRSIRSANSGSIEAGHSSIQSEYPGSIEAE